MSETSKFVMIFFLSLLSFPSLLQIIYNACSTGILVKRETTSCELNISSSLLMVPFMYVVKSFEFLTWCLVVPNKGPSIFPPEP